jgi:hypothetical protein
MKTKITLSIIGLLVLLGTAYGRVPPKIHIQVSPSTELDHNIKVDAVPGGIGHVLRPQKMIGFFVKFPVTQAEHEFSRLMLIVSDETHVLATASLSTTQTNGIATGYCMLAEDQIPLSSITVSYRNKAKEGALPLEYGIDVKAYLKEYKTDHNQKLDPTVETQGTAGQL